MRTLLSLLALIVAACGGRAGAEPRRRRPPCKRGFVKNKGQVRQAAARGRPGARLLQVRRHRVQGRHRGPLRRRASSSRSCGAPCRPAGSGARRARRDSPARTVKSDAQGADADRQEGASRSDRSPASAAETAASDQRRFITAKQLSIEFGDTYRATAGLARAGPGRRPRATAQGALSTPPVLVSAAPSAQPRRMSAPAQRPGRLAHPDDRAGTPPATALAGMSLGTTAFVPITRCRRSSRRAGCRRRSRSRVVADADVALVDPLEADRPLDLDDAVVEVDEHHPVGDDALAADRHVLVGGDRALLADHGLGADPHLALVDADLAAVAEPRPAPRTSRASRPISKLTPGATKQRPSVWRRAAKRSFSQPRRTSEPRVLEVEHAVGAHEAQEHERPAWRGGGSPRTAAGTASISGGASTGWTTSTTRMVASVRAPLVPDLAPTPR